MGGESCLAELVSKRGADVHEGFATGDDGEAAGVCGGGPYEFGYRITGVTGGVPAVLDIAPDAADVAAAEPDKPGGFSLVEAFTLEGVELLHDGEGGFGREGRGCCGSGRGLYGWISCHF